MTLSISSYLVLILEYKAINHGNQITTSQSENGVEASCFLALRSAREKGGNKRSLSKEFSDHIVCLSLLLHHGHFCYWCYTAFKELFPQWDDLPQCFIMQPTYSVAQTVNYKLY